MPEKEAREFAKEHNCSYFETSGITGENLEEAFFTITQQILEFQQIPSETPYPTPESEPNSRKCF